MIGEGTQGRRIIREQAQRDAGGAGPVSFAKKFAKMQVWQSNCERLHV